MVQAKTILLMNYFSLEYYLLTVFLPHIQKSLSKLVMVVHFSVIQQSAIKIKL